MLEKFFRPGSVAVIGASRTPGKVGHNIISNLTQHGFEGEIYPVNPKAKEILGKRCYPDVVSIPKHVDLAVVAIPASLVKGAIEQCGKKKIEAAIILSAGFRESGSAGAKRERELLAAAKAAGVRLLGPNCLGIIDTYSKLNASFAASMPPRGNIAFLSQSGALCTAILDWALGEDLGFSRFVSLGNKADINEVDFLEDLGRDKETRVILAYLEGVNEGARFLEVARKVAREKPIIIVKSGSTSAGARAASSHTGSLAGSETAYRAAFSQAGIIRADSIQDLFHYALAFSCQTLPQGNRLAIVTNGGGPGIIAADACERMGVRLARFSEETILALKRDLPPTAAVYNPIDMIGDAPAERFVKALEPLREDPNVDGVMVILAPQAMTGVEDSAEIVASFAEKTSKPVLAAFMGGRSIGKGVSILKKNKVPNYLYPEDAVEAFQVMSRYRAWKEEPPGGTVSFSVDRDAVKALLGKAKEARRANLRPEECSGILAAYGFRTPQVESAGTAEEAVAIADKFGYPVVIKINSPEIQHKSDVGGVRLGVGSAERVRLVFQEMVANAHRLIPRAVILGVSVHEMASGGKEVILGWTRDPQFGPLIMFGLGGIYVEVIKDVSFRIAPLSLENAEEMMRETKAYVLLRGVRGEKPVDLGSVRDALLRLSQMACDFSEIVECDLNPLMVKPEGEGAIVIDSRFTIEAE